MNLSLVLLAAGLSMIAFLILLTPGEADWEYWTRRKSNMVPRDLSEVPKRFHKTQWYIERTKRKKEKRCKGT